MANGFQDIIRQMQTAQEKANLLNEQRYQQALAQFETLGQAGRTRIERQAAQRQATATQSLISRGLGGTTITSAVGRGIASDVEFQRQQLEESVAMQKAGLIERRTDVGPDLGMFANLLQAAGQEQVGAGPGGRQLISGGLGPMASRGLTAFGQPFKYFGGEAGGGAGGEAGGGAGAGAGISGAGMNVPGAPGGVFGPGIGGLDLSPQVTPSFGPGTAFMGEKGFATGLPAAETGIEEDIGRSKETYAQYKARVGRSAVSPTYWNLVLKGRR